MATSTSACLLWTALHPRRPRRADSSVIGGGVHGGGGGGSSRCERTKWWWSSWSFNALRLSGPRRGIGLNDGLRRRAVRHVGGWCRASSSYGGGSKRAHDGRRDWEMVAAEIRWTRNVTTDPREGDDEGPSSVSSSSVPMRTVLGVDYGRRRTGLAVTTGGIAPRPLGVISSSPPDALLRRVVETAINERAQEIVVGLPVPPGKPARPRGKDGGEEQPGSRDVFVSVRHLAKFRSAWELESLGMAALKEHLAGFGLKVGGTLQERAERLFALVELRGNVTALAPGCFANGDAGKMEAVAAAAAAAAASRAAAEEGAPRVGPSTREGPVGGVGGASSGGTVSGRGGVTADTRGGSDAGGGRPAVQMHRICRRFAENLADAAAPHGLPVRMYDEAHTSQQAELSVEVARAARGAAVGLAPGTHLDDVAAAILLERYFARTHGDPIEVPPRLGLGPPELGRRERSGGRRKR